LRAQQRARFARLMRDLGWAARADEQRRLAAAEIGADAAKEAFDVEDARDDRRPGAR
jgi:hypothetical protein